MSEKPTTREVTKIQLSLYSIGSASLKTWFQTVQETTNRKITKEKFEEAVRFLLRNHLVKKYCDGDTKIYTNSEQSKVVVGNAK